MKIFTSLAAFGVLGADYRFETRLLTAGEQRGDTLRGDLYLQGSGDPTLHPDDLDTFAAALAQRGIRHIQGRLLLDAGAFDQTPFGTGWSWDDEPFAFAAPISALNYAFTPAAISTWCRWMCGRALAPARRDGRASIPPMTR